MAKNSGSVYAAERAVLDAIRNQRCVECGKPPRHALEGGWPVARCRDHPDSLLRGNDMAEDSTTELVVHDPTDTDVNQKVAVFKKDQKKFIAAHGVDVTDADMKALAYYSVRYDLDPVAGEVMIFQGSPYITLDGMIRKARESGMLDFLHEVPVPAEVVKDLQANIPVLDDKPCERCKGSGKREGDRECTTCLGTGDNINRAYVAGARIKLRGSSEAVVAYSYVMKSEISRANSQTRQGRTSYQPIVTNTQKLALARAKRKAIRDSGLGMAHFISDLDAGAAISEARAMLGERPDPAITVESETLPANVTPVEAAATPDEPAPQEAEPGPEDAPEANDATPVSEAQEPSQVAETPPQEPDPTPEVPKDAPIDATATSVAEDETDAGFADEADAGATEDSPSAVAPDDFTIEELDTPYKTITKFAASLGYGQRSLASALLIDKVTPDTCQSWTEAWTTRGTCYLIKAVADQAVKDNVSLKSPKLSDVAIVVHADHMKKGTWAWNPENEAVQERATASA